MKLDSASLLPGARLRGIIAAATCVLVQPVVHGQTWSGAASHWWNDPANWDGGMPVSGPTTELLFKSSSRLGPNNNLSDPFVLRTLYFGPTAPGFQLTGAPLAFAADSELLQDGANEQILHNVVQIPFGPTLLTVGGDGTGGITLMGGLEGPGQIVKSGSFDLRLNGSGAGYTGKFTVGGGRVIVGHASALEKSTVLMNTPGGLVFATSNATLGGLEGSLNFSFGSTNLSVGANNEHGVYTGSISNGGSTSFRKVGTGTLTLTGVNTYGGSTIVQEGTLYVVAGGRIGSGAHPVIIGGDPLNPGLGKLILDGVASQVTGSVFTITPSGELIVQNGGKLAGLPGQNPALVIDGGAFTGFGTFDVTLANGPRVTATAPLTLHKQAGPWDGELTVNNTRLTVHAPGPQLLQAVTTLNTSTELATIVAPNGLTLAPGGQLHGSGLIRGPFIDQTGGAGIIAQEANSIVLTEANFGSEQWTFLNLLPQAHAVTIDGGRVDTLGQLFGFGTSITGRGEIVAKVTNLLAGGIGNGGPSTITLTGDLKLGSPLPGPASFFHQTTFNLGAHRFHFVGDTVMSDSVVNLEGGTLHAPQIMEEGFSTTSFAGFGIVVTGTDYTNSKPVAPVAIGALSAAANLQVPAGQIAHLVSNAPVTVSNVELSGGQLVSKAGFVVGGSGSVSGFGMLDGAMNGSLEVPLVATGDLPVYEGIIRSGTARILSASPTVWKSADNLNTTDVETVPATGATVTAPAGLILETPGAGGPVTIHAPNVGFANEASVGFASTTIRGALNFGSSKVYAMPNATVDGPVNFGSADVGFLPGFTATGPATMNGAILRNVSDWSLATPLVGNGFVGGTIPTGLTIVPQGSPSAAGIFHQAAGDVLIVSETPYVIDAQEQMPMKGMYRATNGLTLRGSFSFEGISGAEAIVEASAVRVAGSDEVRAHATLGLADVEDAVEIGDLQTANSTTTLLSATPIPIAGAWFQVFSEVHATADLHMDGVVKITGAVGKGVHVSAPITGNAMVEIYSFFEQAAHTLVSVDATSGTIRGSDVTLLGLPGGAPALLPRTSDIQYSSIDAPQGVWFRPDTTSYVVESSFHGKLIVDGTIEGPSQNSLTVSGMLTGSGVVQGGTLLTGPDAYVNPGGIGTTGTLTMGDVEVWFDPEGDFGKFTFELGPDGFDRLIITGDFFLFGSLSVSLLDGFTLGPDLSFPIVSIDGGLWGQFTGLDEGAVVGTFGGWDLYISYTAGDGDGVTLYTVPEPGASVYLAGLAVVLAGRRRRVEN